MKPVGFDRMARENGCGSSGGGLGAVDTAVQHLTGVGPKRAAQLATAGIQTVGDLLQHLPFRYEDRRQIKKIAGAAPGEQASFVGRLAGLQKKYILRLRSQMLLGVLADETGSIDLVWYRAPKFLIAGLVSGATLLVHGKVEPSLPGRLRLVHPDFELIENADRAPPARILPIYVHPAGLPLSLLRRYIAQAWHDYAHQISEPLPPAIIRKQGLMPLRAALGYLHDPPNDADVRALSEGSSPAHRSVVFDELFYLQLGLGLRRRQRCSSAAIRFGTAPLKTGERMRELLPFKLTAAQERVIAEVDKDMAAPVPMQRLVQGDVGSGKTMVAWFASLRAIEHGRQALWMVPTEILAEQHYRTLEKFAGSLGISVVLLTGATPTGEKRAALERISMGEVSLVIGTHALIQEEVYAPRIGLGVIDEQHRFGVLQRLSLQRLGGRGIATQPHILLMSATPIPRSLAMVLYGDMEVSFVDQLPPERGAVRTQVFRQEQRRQAYGIVLDQLKRGRQALVVLPLVEASAQLKQLRDATQMAEKMRQSLFKNYGVGLVHGRLKPEERDRIMRAFRDGKLGILVATTVVEVGIDIPNATVMVVEHAERFGLSQLHQLRGRIGRGTAAGYCLLIDRGTGGELAAERLRVMARERDGFKIAEADLRLRGPGEMLGARQSGLTDFRFANLARDTALLAQARSEALAWLDSDPDLSGNASAGMRRILRDRWGKLLELALVG